MGTRLRLVALSAAVLTMLGSAGIAQQTSRQEKPAANGQPAAQDQPPPAQSSDQPPPQPPPQFRTGINFVRVDVIVSDKSGNPVGDLKAEDFEVSEEGKPQKVET